MRLKTRIKRELDVLNEQNTPQDWGPGILRHVKLFSCGQNSNAGLAQMCGMGPIPHSSQQNLAFNNLCLDIKDQNGNQFDMGQGSIVFVEYQGQVYKMTGTWASNQINSCSAYGMGPVEDATVVTACKLNGQGSSATNISPYYDANVQPCNTTSPPVTCMEIKATVCTGGTNATWPCATIDGQIPDSTYVGTTVDANNGDWEITAINPSTSSPYGTQDFQPGNPCSTQTPCDTTTASPCAVQWWQNPNATWASNWITNRDCSNYNWPATNLETQATAIMAGAPNVQTGPFNNASDIWAAANASGLVNPQKGQFIGKMAKAKYSQCQKQACNC